MSILKKNLNISIQINMYQFFFPSPFIFLKSIIPFRKIDKVDVLKWLLKCEDYKRFSQIIYYNQRYITIKGRNSNGKYFLCLNKEIWKFHAWKKHENFLIVIRNLKKTGKVGKMKDFSMAFVSFFNYWFRNSNYSKLCKIKIPV